MLFTPTSFIWSRISFWAPLPMAIMAMTAATPKMIQREVRMDRNLLMNMASMAIFRMYL